MEYQRVMGSVVIIRDYDISGAWAMRETTVVSGGGNQKKEATGAKQRTMPSKSYDNGTGPI